MIGTTSKSPLVGGTPAFMAPELFKLETAHGANSIDPSSPQVFRLCQYMFDS